MRHIQKWHVKSQYSPNWSRSCIRWCTVIRRSGAIYIMAVRNLDASFTHTFLAEVRVTVRQSQINNFILQCLKLTDWLQASLKLQTRLGGWINTICACTLIMAHSAPYFRCAFLLSQWLDFVGYLETANWQVRSRIASHTAGNRE